MHQPYDEAFLKKMASGVAIGTVVTRPCKLTPVSKDTFKIVLTQGMNRQIRKMCLACGYTVTRLERIRNLFLEIENLPYGKWRHLTGEEVTALKL